MTELEYHHSATSSELMNLGINQWLLESQRETTGHQVPPNGGTA